MGVGRACVGREDGADDGVLVDGWLVGVWDGMDVGYTVGCDVGADTG